MPDNQPRPAGQRYLSQPTTDVGPATPAPDWCLPGTDPEWDCLTEEFGGGAVCSWSRYFPPDDGGVGAGVWIRSDDRIVDGRVLRTEPAIHFSEPSARGLAAWEARKLAAELLNGADVLDAATT